MARARKDIPKAKEVTETVAVVEEHPITRTLEENYMPYSMSVIISRAIPEIDGFKPAHRKLLYMMYKKYLLLFQCLLNRHYNIVEPSKQR